MALSDERLEELNRMLNERTSKPTKKQKVFVEALKQMNENAKESRKKHNEYIDMLYRHRVEDVRETIVRKRRFFRNDVYVGYISGSNPMEDTALVFFGEMLRQDHQREWDHNPTDEELYEFVVDVYGEPKYREPTNAKYTICRGKGLDPNSLK